MPLKYYGLCACVRDEQRKIFLLENNLDNISYILLFLSVLINKAALYEFIVKEGVNVFKCVLSLGSLSCLNYNRHLLSPNTSINTDLRHR